MIKEISQRLFDYLGLDPIPIEYEELELEDSRIYFKELKITIANRYKNNSLEIIKCLAHEIRHYYQLMCVAINFQAKPMVDAWKDEFKMNNIKPEDALCLLIEIDAFAFTKYILRQWYNIEYHHYDALYDELLEKYLKIYL